ncbi:helix-hairpin-helix domain-containing protein [Terrisporobacter petrolearius]|uniref:helix-hairpin-helix domain-containing protein n=1 Tax=Terrisporobacter petrolearius TaxID=1460447 RepID=UPI001D16DA43|nr:helix-hairpin-helix domain-containing protein [Terrisporobacter petrolearius]MCC3863318.1 helix-hairpin-helix domain-containing protein [Terrisporobacter petrolearius]
MNKKKIIVFIFIILMCPIGLVIKDKLQSKENVYVLTEDENQPEKTTEEKEVKKEESVTNKKITVYISGEVSKPGIVSLNEGERLATAVQKVGGTTKKADLDGVNMAIKVQDEMHYIIPKVGAVDKHNATQVVKEGDVNDVNKGESSKASQININTATIEELDTLPGVGEATANKIVNHRGESGDFKSIEEIKNVNGIGDKKFEDMKDLICVK